MVSVKFVIGSIISFLGLLATVITAWVTINKRVERHSEAIENLQKANAKQDKARERFEDKIEAKFEEFATTLNNYENIVIRMEAIVENLEKREMKK